LLHAELLKSELILLKAELAEATATTEQLQSKDVSSGEEMRLLKQKMIGMSEEMSVLREECGEARRQAAEFDAELRRTEANMLDAKLRDMETVLTETILTESRRNAREIGSSVEEKSNDIDTHFDSHLGGKSMLGSGHGRSAREDELGLQLAMAKSKCEECEGEIRRLQEIGRQKFDEIRRLTEREKDKELAITTYVHNATHFEEEIQKHESRLSVEQDVVERCRKVIGSTMDYLNGFLRINGVPELTVEGVGGTRWNPPRFNSILSVPQSAQFMNATVDQLEGLSSQVERRLNEVLDIKMAGSHVDAIKYRSLKNQDVALFLPVQASEENTWNYHAFVVGKMRYYLSADSLASLHSKLSNSTSSMSETLTLEDQSHRAPSRTWPAFILGRVVFSESHVASKEHNPYDLEEGTEFHIITAEIFHDSCGAALPMKEENHGYVEGEGSSSLPSSSSTSGSQRSSLPPQPSPPLQRERGITVEEMTTGTPLLERGSMNVAPPRRLLDTLQNLLEEGGETSEMKRSTSTFF